MARLARDPEVEALIDAYRADLIAAGHFAENEVTSPARAFLLRIGGRSGGRVSRSSSSGRLRAARERGGDVDDRCRSRAARPEFLVRGYQRLGKVAAWVHRDFHRRFMQVAADDRVRAEGGGVAVVGGREGRRGRGRARRRSSRARSSIRRAGS